MDSGKDVGEAIAYAREVLIRGKAHPEDIERMRNRVRGEGAQAVADAWTANNAKIDCVLEMLDGFAPASSTPTTGG